MPDTRLVKILENQLQGYAARDVERTLKSFADDAVLQDMADPHSPYVGSEAIKGFLVEYFATVEDVNVEITSLATNDNVVLAELEVSAKYVGEPHSHENPRDVVMRYAMSYRIRKDGLIERERFYMDAAEFQRQIAA